MREKKEKKEEEEAPAAPVEKKPDPFEKMPKGTFDLEEWKRFYSNNDEPESVAWFWEHFDHDNYSIWREITSTMMSSPWSSCPATSSEECSRGWTNSTRTPSPPCVCSVRTMTPPSAVSGYSEVTSWLSSWMTTGKWTTPAITGESWTASLMSARSWWTSTGSGRELMRAEDLS